MMMFFEVISDKSSLQLAIAVDTSFFVPHGGVKKCVDVESGHTLKAPDQAGRKGVEDAEMLIRSVLMGGVTDWLV
jgi:hypothetical protein